MNERGLERVSFDNVLIDNIIEEIENLKGEQIKVLDLRKLENRVSDFFIICSGNSRTHTIAISEAIQRSLKKRLKQKPWHVEGVENAQWILIDYVNVVIHIFLPEFRDYYELENLWGDADIVEVSNRVIEK